MDEKSRALIRATVFVAIVMIVSWAFGAYVFAEPDRMWLFNRVMFVPGLIGLIMRVGEKRDFRHLFAPLIVRLDLSSVAFAILYPLAVIATCALLVLAAGLASVDTSRVGMLVPHISLFAVLAVMGEEYGWRGYLLPTLSKWKGQRVATVIVGLVWAVWHAPFLYLLATRLNTAAPLTLCVIQMFAVFVISFPFSYVYFRRGSIVPPMILHFVWNEYNPSVLGNIYRNQPGLLFGDILTINGEGVVGVAVGAVAALWFVRRLGTSSGSR